MTWFLFDGYPGKRFLASHCTRFKKELVKEIFNYLGREWDLKSRPKNSSNGISSKSKRTSNWNSLGMVFSKKNAW